MSTAATTRQDDGARAPGSPGSYGRGVVPAAAALLVLGAAAVGAAWTVPLAGGARSIIFGAGLVALSAAATVLVAAVLFRAAPAATAPALAGLYLVKALAFGWLLVVPGTPAWLVPGPFVVAVVVTLAGATVGDAALARRVTNRETPARSAAPADPVPATEEEDQP